MFYRLTYHDSPIHQGHWNKDLATKVPLDIWWLDGEGPLTGSLAGRTWRESRFATEPEIDLWKEILRLRNLVDHLVDQPGKLCGAKFEHAGETCELLHGHSGNHVTRTSGGVLVRP